MIRNTVSGRTRGYRFENDIAKRYVRCGWRAWRPGASSNGLPDILAVGVDRIHVHELKTTIRDTVRIPAHQIERCMDVAESFPKYTGYTILSARFGRKAEYHYLWDGKPVQVSINIRVVLSMNIQYFLVSIKPNTIPKILGFIAFYYPLLSYG